MLSKSGIFGIKQLQNAQKQKDNNDKKERKQKE